MKIKTTAVSVIDGYAKVTLMHVQGAMASLHFICAGQEAFVEGTSALWLEIEDATEEQFNNFHNGPAS